MEYREWEPPFDIDEECARICIAINSLPGIWTYESCCGHGKHPFWVWLEAESLDVLTPLAMLFSRNYGCRDGWRLTACHVEIPESRVTFCIEGPTGDYDGAEYMAQNIWQRAAEIGRATEEVRKSD